MYHTISILSKSYDLEEQSCIHDIYIYIHYVFPKTSENSETLKSPEMIQDPRGWAEHFTCILTDAYIQYIYV